MYVYNIFIYICMYINNVIIKTQKCSLQSQIPVKLRIS